MARNKPQRTRLPAGIVLVADAAEKLLGIATDGDIRRALSQGAGLDSPVSLVMNKNPFLIIGPHSGEEILALIADKIRQESWHKDRLDKIVVVDRNRKVLNLVSFYDLWHQSDIRFKHIGMVGLGYVGLTLGLTLADLGFRVKGVDADPKVRRAVSSGKPHFFEAGLDALIKDHLGGNFKVAENFKGENNCDIYFVAVGTPLDRSQKPDLAHLRAAAKNLGRILKRGDLIILRSTVPVGTTRDCVAPILEKYSGLRAGEEFLLAFAPERTAEGRALEELRKLPQVIGGINHKSADMAASVFGFMTHSNVLVDTLEEAEMVKLVNNTYRDVTFGFANEVSLVAQHWGLEARKIIEAANYGYERSNVPMPSPGVGGYCLEKDPFIFIESAKVKGYNPLLFRHARAINERMVDFVAGQVLSFLEHHKAGIKNPKILIFGLAFKGHPMTSDLRGSTALSIVTRLQKAGFGNVFGYDPAVKREEAMAYGVRQVNNLEVGARNADAMVVLNSNPHFQEIEIRKYLALSRKPTLLFDGWGVFNQDDTAKIKGVHYKRL